MAIIDEGNRRRQRVVVTNHFQSWIWSRNGVFCWDFDGRLSLAPAVRMMIAPLLLSCKYLYNMPILDHFVEKVFGDN